MGETWKMKRQERERKKESHLEEGFLNLKESCCSLIRKKKRWVYGGQLAPRFHRLTVHRTLSERKHQKKITPKDEDKETATEADREGAKCYMVGEQKWEVKEIAD